MVHAVIYCLRGWLAFVAFIELSNAMRCFIDQENYLQQHLFPPTDTDKVTVSEVMARVLGRYCLLNSLVYGHCALYMEQRPLIALSVATLALSILFYGSEAFYYYTAPPSFYSIFPILIALVTMVMLLIAPAFLEAEVPRKKPATMTRFDLDDEDEEDEETRVIKQRQAQTLSHLMSRMKKVQ